ncbi:MAG TPA: porin [Burkholderiales bacterium]|nr:porin [Burkholderiales bacterium]HYA47829.1 porin [Burkholderiales bacterium]
MKKIVLASAISALFAAPVVAFAQAKPPAAPTLDKIFEASGITESGYIDAGYTYANKNLQGGAPVRVFDAQNNSFVLHQLGLTLAKQPKEGFGGLVNVTVGNDAQVIHSFPENNPLTTPVTGGPASSMFDITQAYLQYASGSLTVIGGKFTTLAGTEVIASPSNNNISRSMLFGAVPFTHTGVRATWAATDTFSLIAGVNNGWDQLTDANRNKTAELGLTWNPMKPLNIAVSAYDGPEPTGLTTNGSRSLVDAVVSFAFTDSLSIGLEYLTFSQDNAIAGAKAKYSGYAGYLTWMLNPKWRLALRAESFDDHDGFHFLTTALPTPGTKYTEGTVTIAFIPADNFELRAEAREDKANQAVFVGYDGSTSKTQMTVALQGLYKF